MAGDFTAAGFGIMATVTPEQDGVAGDPPGPADHLARKRCKLFLGVLGADTQFTPQTSAFLPQVSGNRRITVITFVGS